MPVHYNIRRNSCQWILKDRSFKFYRRTTITTMAAHKQPKAGELLSIYRLEFYKKQKKWKLTPDARREKEAQKCLANQKILNETYSIEADIDDKECDHNEAFLLDEPEEETATSKITLRTQVLEPILACQECEPNIRKEPEKPWAHCVDDALRLEEQLDMRDCGNVSRCSGDEFDEFDGGLVGSMVWTNSGCPQNLSLDAEEQEVKVQETMQQCPQQWEWDQNNHWADDQMWLPEIWSEEQFATQTVEDVEAFLRGAGRAPHSSEIEIALPDEVDLMCNASSMSAAQLDAAIAQHRRSVHVLLQEAHRRIFLSTVSLDTCVPKHYEWTPSRALPHGCHESFPTRDPGLHCTLTTDGLLPHNRAIPTDAGPNFCHKQLINSVRSHARQFSGRMGDTLDLNMFGATFDFHNMFAEEFVANSFRTLQVDVVGRGRGRLPPNVNK